MRSRIGKAVEERKLEKKEEGKSEEYSLEGSRRKKL